MKSGFAEDREGKPAAYRRELYFPSEESSTQPRPGLLLHSGPEGSRAALGSPDVLAFQDLISEQQAHLQT